MFDSLPIRLLLMHSAASKYKGGKRSQNMSVRRNGNKFSQIHACVCVIRGLCASNLRSCARKKIVKSKKTNGP